MKLPPLFVELLLELSARCAPSVDRSVRLIHLHHPDLHEKIVALLLELSQLRTVVAVAGREPSTRHARAEHWRSGRAVYHRLARYRSGWRRCIRALGMVLHDGSFELAHPAHEVQLHLHHTALDDELRPAGDRHVRPALEDAPLQTHKPKFGLCVADAREIDRALGLKQGETIPRLVRHDIVSPRSLSLRILERGGQSPIHNANHVT